jgi:hypothetical protein
MIDIRTRAGERSVLRIVVLVLFTRFSALFVLQCSVENHTKSSSTAEGFTCVGLTLPYLDYVDDGHRSSFGMELVPALRSRLIGIV